MLRIRFRCVQTQEGLASTRNFAVGVVINRTVKLNDVDATPLNATDEVYTPSLDTAGDPDPFVLKRWFIYDRDHSKFLHSGFSCGRKKSAIYTKCTVNGSEKGVAKKLKRKSWQRKSEEKAFRLRFLCEYATNPLLSHSPRYTPGHDALKPFSQSLSQSLCSASGGFQWSLYDVFVRCCNAERGFTLSTSPGMTE